MRSVLGGRHAGLAPFTPGILAEYERCASSREAIHAICEDYRASASIDLVHDRADRYRGLRVRAPLLVLWGGHGTVGRCFDVLGQWGRVASDVRGHSLPCGHYLPEEAPQALLEALIPFFDAAVPKP